METKRFYDIHFHSMDLSHPNLTAFIDKIVEGTVVGKEDVKNIVGKLGWARFLPIPACVLAWFPGPVIRIAKKIIKKKDLLKSANRARNLLAFMESPIEYDFLIMEYFMKYKRPGGESNFTPPVIENNLLKIGDKEYNRIVLCPLVIDFGYKNLKQNGVFYNIPPEKPIKKQISDLFRAIQNYYNNDLDLVKTEITVEGKKEEAFKFQAIKTATGREAKLFEIYPFMGINTANYDFDSIELMLNKYFKEFSISDTPDQRYLKLSEKSGKFGLNLDNADDCKNIFAGVKVYPPLGFNPWPDSCPSCSTAGGAPSGCKCERDKVRLLYSFCAGRNIPLITHCSDGGFVADPDHLRLTNPGGKWADVLNEFPSLKIDFAHFGRGSDSWETKIKEYLSGKFSSVYTDFSCNTQDDVYYERIEKMLAASQNHDKLSRGILFGSDFMINMLWIESYNYYIKTFAESRFMKPYKHLFCHKNPEHFLFGGSLTV